MNYSLQIARGIAAIIVSFHHLFLGPFFRENPDSFLKATHINLLGGLAVYFFFALSGYVLTLSVSKKEISSARFMKDRILRIYPEYILWTCLAYFLWSITSGSLVHLNYVPKSIADWVHTLTLIPPLFSSDSFAMLLSVAWSLVYEMWFYILFAILMIFVKENKKIIPLLMIFIFFVLHIIINGNLDVQRHRWVYLPYIFSDFISLAFALGSLIFFVKPLSFKSNLIPIGIIRSLLCIMVFSRKNIASAYVYVVLSSMILYLTLSINITSEFVKKLSFLGDASYTIYLIHVIFSTLAWKNSSYGNYFLLGFNILVVLIGCALYQYVSKPINRFIKSKF